MPLFIASMAVSTLAKAVSRMTGIASSRALISLKSVSPSMGFMRRSVTTTSAPPARTTSRAAAPSRAASTS